MDYNNSNDRTKGASIVLAGVLVLLFLVPVCGGSYKARAEESPSPSSTLRFTSLDYAALEYRDILNMRDAYFSSYETIDGKCTGNRMEVGRGDEKSKECFKYGSSVLFDLSLIEHSSNRFGSYRVFWNNDVHMMATNVQVRQVGWKWELGISISNKVSIFHRHHSIHVMEREDYREKVGKFPLQDEYVIRLELYKR